ncbi:MAG: hypothetical protein ACI9UJ_002275 [bacterium]|jgi:hypothetical protein
MLRLTSILKLWLLSFILFLSNSVLAQIETSIASDSSSNNDFVYDSLVLSKVTHNGTTKEFKLYKGAEIEVWKLLSGYELSYRGSLESFTDSTITMISKNNLRQTFTLNNITKIRVYNKSKIGQIGGGTMAFLGWSTVTIGGSVFIGYFTGDNLGGGVSDGLIAAAAGYLGVQIGKRIKGRSFRLINKKTGVTIWSISTNESA